VEQPAAALPVGLDTLQALGLALVSPDGLCFYLFEVASVLMLAALVGAVLRCDRGQKVGD